MGTVEQAIRLIVYFAGKRAVFLKEHFSKIFVSLRTSSYGMDGIPSAGGILIFAYPGEEIVKVI
jgi:hypothetical protein